MGLAGSADGPQHDTDARFRGTDIGAFVLSRAARIALVAAAFLSLPASALADTSVRLDGSGSAKTLRVEAGVLDGQNALGVAPADFGTSFSVREFALDFVTQEPKPVDAGAGCTQIDRGHVTCPTAGVSLITIETKGGRDRAFLNPAIAVRASINLGPDDDLDASGGAGNDVIVGGTGSDGGLAGAAGHDTIFGDLQDGSGNGDDVLFGDGGNDTLRGGVGNDAMTGGDDADTLLGGAGGDDLRGLGGNDRLDGGSGPDPMAGGTGIDRVDYSGRTSTVRVSLNDTIANDGNSDDGPADARDRVAGDVEEVVGGAGGDTLIGDDDPDVLNGQGGDDSLFGQGGNDTLIGSTSADILNGGNGAGDVAFYADHSARVRVTLGDTGRNDGNPIDQNADGFRDQVEADVENVVGTAADDNLTGSDASNVLDGGFGPDFLAGGPGVDFVTYASRSSRVVATIGDGLSNDGNSADGPETARDFIALDVEGVHGTSGNDVLTGNGADNSLFGNAGSDSLRGNGGDDRLDGGVGADTLEGGPGASDTATYEARTSPVTVTLDNLADDGNDADEGRVGRRDNVRDDVENVIGGSAGDTLVGSSAPNELSGFGGDDVLDGGAGADELLGLQGRDRSDYSQRTTPVNVTAEIGLGNDGGAQDGPSGARDTVQTEDVTGGSAADTLIGSGVPNFLSGGGGNDTLDGREADDTLRGGPQADVLIGGPGAEDEADYSERVVGVTVTSAGGVANDGNADDGPSGARDNVGADIEVLHGGAGNDNLTGRAQADKLFGESGKDSLNGGDGNDDVFGGAGNDTLVNGGGPGADSLNGGGDTDLVSYAPRGAGVGVTPDGTPDDGGSADGFADNVAEDVENVTGGAARDVLSGSNRANVLLGGPGDDSIDAGTQGETASDSVDGGTGNDLLDTNDGAVDQALCGPDSDGITADLKDVPPGFADCEAVAIAAFDQHPTLEIVTDEAVVRGGPKGRGRGKAKKRPSTRIRIRCPDSPSHGCQGELSLQPASGDDGVWSSVPYTLRAGRAAVLKLVLPIAVAEEVQRQGSVPARAIATDHDTTGRPKTTAKTIRLVASHKGSAKRRRP